MRRKSVLCLWVVRRRWWTRNILTKLKVEGYEIAPSYEGADLVVVNTCGFIDSAVQESLDAIGEALHENGKVVVTGCLGARTDANGGNLVQTLHPKVLAVTGPHATMRCWMRCICICRNRTIRSLIWCRRRGETHAEALCVFENL